MLTRILVPLDGSPRAEHALTYATTLSDATGASLVLIQAVYSHTMHGVDPRERQTGAIQEAEIYLDEVAGRLRRRGLTCETVIRYGHPAQSVVESARTRHVDLIVMATHGRTGPGRWVFGSVAEAIVARSPVPVLVQRSWQPLLGDVFPGDQRELIVPLDGSVFAETALEPAARLAEDLKAHLALVRVENDVQSMGAALDYLLQVQARVAAQYPTLTVETDIRAGEPVPGIQASVMDRGAALIVMATHGRSGFSRALLGGTADKLMEASDVPLVLMRPAAFEIEEQTQDPAMLPSRT